MWLGSGYGMVAAALPLLLAGPAFFAGAIGLGALVQLGQAFAEVVQRAVLAAGALAADRRLAQPCGADRRARGQPDGRGRAGPARADRRRARRRGLVLGPRHAARPGWPRAGRGRQRHHPCRRAGAGPGRQRLRQVHPVPRRRRAVALGRGPHPHAGRGTATMLLPQRPYLPLGTLRDAVCYPALPGRFADAAIAAALDALRPGRAGGAAGEGGPLGPHALARRAAAARLRPAAAAQARAGCCWTRRPRRSTRRRRPG